MSIERVSYSGARETWDEEETDSPECECCLVLE